MSKAESDSTFTRLQSKYRLVIMNDDTFEEVVTFKLSRLSVYIGFSTIFVFLVGLTIALLVLTPLKYYIPGYGTRQNRSELQALKMRTDSLQQAIQLKQQYIDNIRTILIGNTNPQRDTTVIKVPKPELSND